MGQSFYTVDVFTDRLFSGAQIAVFPEAESLSEQSMQVIAEELNLSETVFILPSRSNAEDFYLRIFSPREELHFAGHPVLAAAKVLHHLDKLPNREGLGECIFGMTSRPVSVRVKPNADTQLIQFAVEVAPIIERFVPEDTELAALLSLPPQALDVKSYSPRLVACDQPYLIVPVRHQELLNTARFDGAAWSQSSAPSTLAQEILLFTPKTGHAQANFAARLMGPLIGQSEDPPIGSALPAFAAYLADHRDLPAGTHTFCIVRGQAPKRESVILVELDKKVGKTLQVRLGGAAVLASQGELYFPSQATAA